jgi:hypothetical protein
MGEVAARYARTWSRREPGDWLPLGVVRLGCGCRWDTLAERIWEPCVTHEAEGHLSAISAGADGRTVLRCLVRDCSMRDVFLVELSAVLAAQDHWRDTRGHAAG